MKPSKINKQHDIKTTTMYAVVGLALLIFAVLFHKNIKVTVIEIIAGGFLGYSLVDELSKRKYGKTSSKVTSSVNRSLGIFGAAVGIIGQIIGGNFADVFGGFGGTFLLLIGIKANLRVRKLPDSYYDNLRGKAEAGQPIKY